MSIDNILSRLKKVKKTGPDRWLACCPAHEDKTPSMAIRELGDGQILIHDFAGCSVEAILESVGLTFDDIFPEKQIDHARPLSRPFNAHDVLEALSMELMVVSVTVSKLVNERDITVAEWERLKLANQRISAARDMVNGNG